MTKKAFITMDVESFYDSSCVADKNLKFKGDHCQKGLEEFLALLNQYQIKATFFVVASFIPYCKDVLLKAIEDGHEIAVHCLTHHDFTLESVSSFEKELKEAEKIIHEELNVTPKGFRAPAFNITNEMLEVLKKEGFKYDSSVLLLRNLVTHNTVNPVNFKKINNVVSRDGNFLEFSPINTRILGFPLTLSGGAYARLFPWFTYKILYKKYIRKNDTYLFYAHPSDLYYAPLKEKYKYNPLELTFLMMGRKHFKSKIRFMFDELKKNNYKFYTMSEGVNDYVK